jgi:hypothetical protein
MDEGTLPLSVLSQFGCLPGDSTPGPPGSDRSGRAHPP